MYRLPHPAIALLCLLLASCGGQQTRLPASSGWAEHSTRLQHLDHWAAEGKLALRTAEKSDSASIRWLQRGDNTELYLSGPMGLNATTVHSNGRMAILRQGDKTSSWDLSDQAAISRETGWELPLQALPYWLKGLPAPDLAIQALELDAAQSLLQSLQQDDWDILYERYDNFGELALPTRLRIQREATGVRVIIRDWQMLPGP